MLAVYYHYCFCFCCRRPQIYKVLVFVVLRVDMLNSDFKLGWTCVLLSPQPPGEGVTDSAPSPEVGQPADRAWLSVRQGERR